MAASNLALCVLFYEKVDQTIKCVESFLPSGVQIYIFNNGSTRSSREALGKYCEKHFNITILDSDTNLGVSVGRNYLIEHTTEEWLLFVDNDIYMKKRDWLENFKRHMSLHPDIEVFIPRLFLTHEDRYQRYFIWEIQERYGTRKIRWLDVIDDLTNNFPGGASFVNRKVFHRLGPYDKEIFVGFEDFEFCARGILIGKPVKALLIHDIELVHDHRLVSSDVDKKAVFGRYDSHILEASANRIFEKHKIILDNRWRIWVANQVEFLLKEYVQKTREPLLIGIKHNLTKKMKKVRSIYNILRKRLASFAY